MTSYASGELTGQQEPRFGPRASRKGSPMGEECAYLAGAYGLTPDPWQRRVIDAWLEADKAGRMRYGTGGLSVPRQNGKNSVLEMIELYKLVAQGRKILHTAHEMATAQAAMNRMLEFFRNEAYPELAALVLDIRTTNGQEAIRLHQRDCPQLTDGDPCTCIRSRCPVIAFKTRTSGGARGLTFDDVVCDEAQWMTDEQLEAVRLVTGAASDPQVFYIGTPPTPGAVGEVFPRLRSDGVEGKNPRLAWFEWSVDEIGNIHDRARWAATNPALGRRLQLTTIEDEAAELTPASFARERLGWWASGVEQASRLISTDEWDAVAVDADSVDVQGRRFLAVAFARDGRMSLAGAVRSDDAIHVEMVDAAKHSERTLPDLAKWLAERTESVESLTICGGSLSYSLIQELADLQVPKSWVRTASTSDYLAACAMLHEAIQGERLTATARDDRQDALSQSVAVCDAKPRGAGWGWMPTIDGGDETPLEAASVAFHAARTAKPPRRRVDDQGQPIVAGRSYVTRKRVTR